ncbi:hypothetical protein GCM10020367_18350 [Streptomyces sannanensis]|uniref:ARG and Rhodanese-Phosphatase-superfamily-associated domain-containing protein n=1 Tax=Streptomyces sannanensis TaxID=285536 RepID=A0ABP6S8D5_9ACTN
MTRLDMTGLSARPAQVWGGIRLVPLVREEPLEGLRLRHEVYGQGYAAVDAGAATYVSYIPHGFVADWSGDGTQSASYGTQLSGMYAEGGPPACVPLRFHHRMAKRGRGERLLRFLPLHLALEGYLALHFGGPTVAWDEWSQQAVRRGLSPRAEAAYRGAEVPGLADALRIFEIHPGQCGVLVYAADALAAAFVVPHPDDYRALHASLLEDLYGELVHQYALYTRPVPEFEARITGSAYVRTLADLRAAAQEQLRAWSEAHDTVFAGGLLDASYSFERVYRMGSNDLWRFLPPFTRGGQEQHIGETITDHKGRVAYLKTFRLSESQIRRGHLLRRLTQNDWQLTRTAEALGTTVEELARRIRAAGFESLLKPDVGHAKQRKPM